MVAYTNYADISTVKDKMTIVTIYAGGNYALKRALPQFAAFKYYRLGPVTIRLIPASTLPVDPTGLSLGAADPGVDPRDQLTPGLVRITNGEDFDTNITSQDATQQHAVFNAMMLDERWFKWSLQSGITKSATPYYWCLGQLRQDYYPGATVNVPRIDNLQNFNLTSTDTINMQGLPNGSNPETYTLKATPNHSSGRGIFQTGQHGQLGWMPTDSLITTGTPGDYKLTPSVNAIPQVELFRVVMPPAYKTRYYYRMYITEVIDFKDPVIQNPETWNGTSFDYYAPADRFIRMTGITGFMPSEAHSISEPGPLIPNDAANSDINIKEQGGENASNNTARGK